MFRERLTISESQSFFNQPWVEAKVFEEAWVHVLRMGDRAVLRDSFGAGGFEKEIAGGSSWLYICLCVVFRV